VDEGVLGTGDAVGAQDVRHGGDLAGEAGVGPWRVLGKRDQDVGRNAQDPPVLGRRSLGSPR
jgi:hypothetical protein